jgi:putative ABC transport system permease protein
VRIRPDLHPREADRIRRLPEIDYAALWAQPSGRWSTRERTQTLTFFGADDGFTEVQGGELVEGAGSRAPS